MKYYDEAIGIDIPQGLSEKINSLANAYFLITGKRLYVTSGFRSAKRQAKAMYDNYKAQRNISYKYADLEADVKNVFTSLYSKPATPAERTIAEMEKVIQSQMDSGKYLSAHQKGNAVDLAKIDIKKDTLSDICKVNGHFFYEEPHCIHITFKD